MCKLFFNCLVYFSYLNTNNCLHFTGTNGVSQIQSRFQFTILMEDHIQLAYNELFSEDKNKLEFEIPISLASEILILTLKKLTKLLCGLKIEK